MPGFSLRALMPSRRTTICARWEDTSPKYVERPVWKMGARWACPRRRGDPRWPPRPRRPACGTYRPPCPGTRPHETAAREGRAGGARRPPAPGPGRRRPWSSPRCGPEPPAPPRGWAGCARPPQFPHRARHVAGHAAEAGAVVSDSDVVVHGLGDAHDGDPLSRHTAASLPQASMVPLPPFIST